MSATAEPQLTLVTGGAGFIGCNVAHRLLSMGRPVRILDTLSRPGVDLNLQWLKASHPKLLDVHVADVRDFAAVERAVDGCAQVFHFAAQVAVTTSLEQPREDFEVNTLGTLNVLEAARGSSLRPGVIYTSTNKVYGGLTDLLLQREGQRYSPVAAQVRECGVAESRALDFHSPYGCSKGAADQYVIDYARSYGLPNVVFRMSCIYGPRQFGTEDQGWVAHFILRALQGQPITIYGDGKQVRDILFVDDLVDAFLLAGQHRERLAGGAFNMGGGPASTISLLDLLDRIEDLHGRRPDIAFDQWRTGDQRYYVSDTRAFEQATGWRRRVEAADGIARLYDWLLSLQRPEAPAASPAAVAAAVH